VLEIFDGVLLFLNFKLNVFRENRELRTFRESETHTNVMDTRFSIIKTQNYVHF
jgi:hypothetical protein